MADVLPVPAQPTPQKSKLEKLFIEIAGADMEIDWRELQRILDHTLRDGKFTMLLSQCRLKYITTFHF